jgi:hypothetical protein
MGLIYHCAAITLVAVSGADSESGLCGVSPPHPRTKQARETIDSHSFFTVPPNEAAEVFSSVWSTRAWTFQEFILSNRRLFFSPTQLIFACQTASFAESSDNGVAGAGSLQHPAVSVVPPLFASVSITARRLPW